jgi:hypothetical protein
MPVQLQRIKFRWLGALVLLAVAYALVGVLVFTKNGKCEKTKAMICGVYTGVAGIALAALIGLFAFVLLTLHIRREYLRRAETQPRSVFPGLVASYEDEDFAVDSEQIRAAIVRAARPRRAKLASGLRPARLEHVPPQLVVGQAGEGKTRMLVQLTGEFANDGFVPVPVSLRDVDAFGGFLDLAREAFERKVGEQLASEDEGDRIWRWMCWSGRLVVLADDLQLLHGVARDGLEIAFLEAERGNYALVVTSRRDGLGSVLDGWTVPISRPDSEEALEFTMDESDPPDPAFDRFALWLIRAGELHESRYYLSILRRLRRVPGFASATPPSNRRFAVRRWVLHAYVEEFIRGNLSREDDLVPKDRKEAVRELGEHSYQALLKGVEARIEVLAPAMQSAVEAGLARSGSSGEGVVEHALLQSYLASRVIDSPKQCKRLIQNEAGTPEARDALLFYAGSDATPERARRVVDALLAQARKRPELVSAVITAADIAATAIIDHESKKLVKALGKACGPAGALDRLAIVDRLARIRRADAITEMWKSGGEGDYRVRWALASALAGQPTPPRLTRRDRAVSAARVLDKTIATGLSDAWELRRNAPRRGPQDDWVPKIATLKRLGWILPPLMVATYSSDGQSAAMLRDLDELLDLFDLREPPGDAARLERLTEQKGPEASIAQGLKAAARLVAWELPKQPAAADTISRLAERLCDLYGRAGFWYSRLVLLHGVADLLIAIERSADLKLSLADQAAELSKTLTKASECSPCPAFSARQAGAPPKAPKEWEHAFVVEAARLCLKALEGARLASEKQARTEREKFIWDDEGVAVGRPGGLDVEALRLLGDVAILLNLNEKGNDGKKPVKDGKPVTDRQLRESFGENDYLPDCLATGKDRWLKVGEAGTECGCAFERCPYPWSARRAHRELSKVFCKRITEEVKAIPPWQRDLSKDSYRHFWLEMEQHAKYVGS